jgi:hypothetical protein
MIDVDEAVFAKGVFARRGPPPFVATEPSAPVRAVELSYACRPEINRIRKPVRENYPSPPCRPCLLASSTY